MFICSLCEILFFIFSLEELDSDLSIDQSYSDFLEDLGFLLHELQGQQRQDATNWEAINLLNFSIS